MAKRWFSSSPRQIAKKLISGEAKKIKVEGGEGGKRECVFDVKENRCE